MTRDIGEQFIKPVKGKAVAQGVNGCLPVSLREQREVKPGRVGGLGIDLAVTDVAERRAGQRGESGEEGAGSGFFTGRLSPPMTTSK